MHLVYANQDHLPLEMEFLAKMLIKDTHTVDACKIE